MTVDFEDFLADLPRGLAAVLAHFSLPRDEAFLAAVGGLAVLRRYSKAPEQPYPPGERGERLAAARSECRDEIARGLAWIERLARADAGIAALAEAGLP